MTLRLLVCTGSNPWGDSMRRWATSSRLIIYLLIGASFSFFAQITAQTTTSGGLTGVITDQTNAVVPNADVDIKNLATGTTQSTKTDREGLYRFFFIAPGSYGLAASHEGFRQELRRVEVL